MPRPVSVGVGIDDASNSIVARSTMTKQSEHTYPSQSPRANRGNSEEAVELVYNKNGRTTVRSLVVAATGTPNHSSNATISSHSFLRNPFKNRSPREDAPHDVLVIHPYHRHQRKQRGGKKNPSRSPLGGPASKTSKPATTTEVAPAAATTAAAPTAPAQAAAQAPAPAAAPAAPQRLSEKELRILLKEEKLQLLVKTIQEQRERIDNNIREQEEAAAREEDESLRRERATSRPETDHHQELQQTPPKQQKLQQKNKAKVTRKKKSVANLPVVKIADDDSGVQDGLGGSAAISDSGCLGDCTYYLPPPTALLMPNRIDFDEVDAELAKDIRETRNNKFQNNSYNYKDAPSMLDLVVTGVPTVDDDLTMQGSLEYQCAPNFGETTLMGNDDDDDENKEPVVFLVKAPLPKTLPRSGENKDQDQTVSTMSNSTQRSGPSSAHSEDESLTIASFGSTYEDGEDDDDDEDEEDWDPTSDIFDDESFAAFEPLRSKRHYPAIPAPKRQPKTQTQAPTPVPVIPAAVPTPKRDNTTKGKQITKASWSPSGPKQNTTKARQPATPKRTTAKTTQQKQMMSPTTTKATSQTAATPKQSTRTRTTTPSQNQNTIQSSPTTTKHNTKQVSTPRSAPKQDMTSKPIPQSLPKNSTSTKKIPQNLPKQNKKKAAPPPPTTPPAPVKQQTTKPPPIAILHSYGHEDDALSNSNESGYSDAFETVDASNQLGFTCRQQDNWLVGPHAAEEEVFEAALSMLDENGDEDDESNDDDDESSASYYHPNEKHVRHEDYEDETSYHHPYEKTAKKKAALKKRKDQKSFAQKYARALASSPTRDLMDTLEPVVIRPPSRGYDPRRRPSLRQTRPDRQRKSYF